MKPTRSFCADEGNNSIGLSGPDAIEADLDQVSAMFDPLSNHKNGESGGIGTENFQNNIIEERHLKDNSVTDIKIGNRTINDNISSIGNTGFLTNLLSYLGKMIKVITGESSWRTTPIDNIKGLDSRIKSNDTDIVNLQNKDTNLQNQINSNDTDILNLQNKDTNLQNQISSNDTDIVNINNTLSSQGSSINNLSNNKANKVDVYTKSEVDNKKFGNKNIENGAIEVKHFNPSINSILPETILSAKVVDIESKLDNQNRQPVSIQRGLNYVEVEQDTMLHNDRIDGKTLVNKLSKDGDFGKDSDSNGLADGWTYVHNGATFSVSNNQQVISTTSGDTGGQRYIEVRNNLVVGKHYFIAGIVEVSGATGQAKLASYDNLHASGVGTPYITDGENKRVGYVFSPTDISTINIGVRCLVSTPQGDISTCKFSKVSFVEIPVEDIGLTEAQLLVKYPYNDSVQHVTNPYFVAKGENLFDGINHKIGALINNYDGSITVPKDLPIEWHMSSIPIKVLPNTDYAISVDNWGYGRLNISSSSTSTGDSGIDSVYSAVIGRGYLERTFNVGNNDTIYIHYCSDDGRTNTSEYTFKLVFNEGTIAKSYKPHKTSHQYFPVTLAEGDYVYKNAKGEYMKHKEWEVLELDGSLGCVISATYTGYKVVKCPMTYTLITSPAYAQKHDGNILQKIYPYTGADQFALDATSLKDIYVTVSSTDSGWGDAWTGSSITQTGNLSRTVTGAEIVKAYFNGWKWRSGSYDWESILDNSVITGDVDKVISTLSNINYTPYKLHYKIATPQEININHLVEGSISLEEGTNEVVFGEGIVVREKAEFVAHKENATLFFINNISSNVNSGSELKYMTKEILELYKNGIEYTNNGIEIRNDSINAYGDADIRYESYNPDLLSNYTVTYTMLDNYPISNSITAEIDGNIGTVVNSLVEQTTHNTTDISVNRKLIDDMDNQEWFEPVLQNGWVNYGSGYHDIKYCKDAMGFVHIEGLIKSGVAGTAFVLPAGFRPSEHFIIDSVAHNGTSQVIASYTIFNTGIITPATTGASYLSFSAVFKAEQ